MTIAEDYFADTGETVKDACTRMYKQGVRIGHATNAIGFRTLSDLRKYLAVRGIECPWPRKEVRKRGKPPIKYTDGVLERYAELRNKGVESRVAATQIGLPARGLRYAIQKRRTDLKLPRGKQKGEPWRRNNLSL